MPWPGIKPMLPALEDQCLKHWTSRKVPVLYPSQQGSWGWHILLLVRLSSSAWLDHGVRSRASGHHWNLSHACPVYDFLIPACCPRGPCTCSVPFTNPHMQRECSSKPRHMLHPRTSSLMSPVLYLTFRRPWRWCWAKCLYVDGTDWASQLFCS